MKKSSLALLLAGIALVVWITNLRLADSPRREEQRVEKMVTTKVVEEGAASGVLPSITPNADQDDRSWGSPPIDAASPAPVETVREKMRRLLNAMHSREAALAYLQCLLDQHSVNRIPEAEFPMIEILDEEELSPEQRQPLTAEEQAKGWVRVVFRVEGRIHTMKSQALPVDFVPEKVRAYLTEDDLRHFQAAQIASNVERNAAVWWKREQTRSAR